MITHLVLCTPRPDLSAADTRSLVQALTSAVGAIPIVRRCTVGRRIRHGAGYEASAGDAHFVVLLEFDDLDALRVYLTHPAHDALSRHFRLSLQDAQAYDFETGGLERLEEFRTG